MFALEMEFASIFLLLVLAHERILARPCAEAVLLPPLKKLTAVLGWRVVLLAELLLHHSVELLL